MFSLTYVRSREKITKVKCGTYREEKRSPDKHGEADDRVFERENMTKGSSMYP